MAQHTSKRARFQVVTGNRLTDGEVVYFTAHDDWSCAFTDAAIADGADAAADLLMRAMTPDIETHIIEPYLFEVYEQSTGYTPASVREIIRTCGPTIRLDLGKQAQNAHGDTNVSL